MNNNEITLEQLQNDYDQSLSRLQPLQRTFVEEYLIDLNASEAAKRAGYSKKTASVQGSRLLRSQKIRQCIDLALELRSRRTGLTTDWVLQELKAHYERCIAAVPVLDRQGNETGQYKTEAASAARTLELIGKHLGMFAEGKDEKHLHLHQDKYVNFPPVPKTIEEWVEQMQKIGYDASIDEEISENESNSKENADN